MQPDFWLKRWVNQELGFQLNQPHSLLLKYAPKVFNSVTSLLVPLCGKAYCLDYLVQHYHQVTGVELSPIAINSFFSERQIKPELISDNHFEYHHHQNLTLMCGDFFALTPTNFNGFYDRAGLIALPETRQQDYVQKLAKLMPAKSMGLLITLEYQSQSGPPFSLGLSEVQQLFERSFKVHYLTTQVVTNTPTGEGFEHVFELMRL